MKQTYRINGGLINKSKPIKFTFNNKQMTGYEGDTLASALLANGQRLVGRSFKYHRPRGIFSSGSEEPNALVQLRSGAHQEPNTRATVVELFDGLTSESQNHRGSLDFDIMSVTDLLSPFLGAGFYYKTFMWPKAFWEKIYEPIIRSSAGLGSLSKLEDPDKYDKGFLHCDLLIAGAGPSGLTAALAAGRAGARVIIADEDFLLGGRLLEEEHTVSGISGQDWVQKSKDELDAMPNVRILTRTTVYGSYDHGIYGALERKTDHLADSGNKPRQVLWRIYSKRAMICGGATERSIAFPNNDRPGIMLAGSVRAYATRYGVAAGANIAIFTNNDSGWQTAVELVSKGINVTAVIDPRDTAPRAHIPGVAMIMGASVCDTKGRKALNRITLTNGQVLNVDCLAVSGGWSPNVHLTCHQRGRPIWNDEIAGFVPGGNLPVGQSIAGASNGEMTLGAAIKSGHKTANAIIKELGLSPSRSQAPKAEDESFEIMQYWHVAGYKQRAWIDLQNDVTSKDVKQSQAEGFKSVEHLKRYTTLGMATDQGKTSNILGLAVMAEATGKTIPETGTTIFRPPYSPVAIGAFGGRERGQHFHPTRLTPSHNWANEQGAEFVEVGNWMRAQWFPKSGDKTWRDSVDREVTKTRKSVGVCDVSTLGKIDIKGKDAAEFLNKIYSNPFAKVPVGRVRYGLMLREDGICYDDGTTARLAEDHFVMTTTTANAVLVYRNMEFARQCLFPDLDVHLISTTDQWAQFAIAGPNSRAVLSKIIDKVDMSNDGFPFMACSDVTVCGGTPGRLFRISFSGELAYEVAVPARYGDALIREIMAAGEEFDITPYGTEALGVMRIEKGHVTGAELNGQMTAFNINMNNMVSAKKDSIGSVLSRREVMVADNQVRLVGVKTVEKTDSLSSGAHFLAKNDKPTTTNDQGWITSVCYSPHFEQHIGLGFLERGHERHGEIIRAWDGVRGTDVLVEIVSSHMYDPEGGLQRG
ncbi:sarcosine oxidase subunit alpha family protein [Amylibacter sp.]|nr:sarcosine oxidase subunit alpha family protein [Amylibacter sp.]